jgi:PII-like signaling protein
MKPINAKLVVIIAETAIEEQVIHLIKSLGISGYLVYHGITGKGDKGVWAGFDGIGIFGDNFRIETLVFEEAQANLIMDEVYSHFFKQFAGIVYTSDIKIVCNDLPPGIK